MRYCLVFVIGLLICASSSAQKMCHYSNYQWNTLAKKAVNFRQISHPYRELKDFEVDPVTGCSVCREDQQWIKVAQLKPVLVCQKLANKIESNLNHLVQQGQPIFKIVSYRVGMTRGKTDEQGNRTRFSNHSFGIAIDINDEQNGLYDHCLVWSNKCRLRKGGQWDPNREGSLTQDHPIVLQLKKAGLKWGGDIQGKQKDFMHFSPSGY